ncbi:phosphopeptide-binding protein [Leptospira kobayashii]|uniref:Phosphopeptide-binding protein n=1 Tax=Leptospira kobayashii TaxID=1917830 RepID=A0ABM7USE6_9LEPT|nr:FHA domain-containing protein [Leptospira kobayashii]BDA78964.1 phosphopeptide-binding protein [Leptospira kobayashii]
MVRNWKRQDGSFCKSRFVLIFLSLCFGGEVFAEKRFQIIDWDVSGYPEIQVDLKTRIPFSASDSEIQILEDIAGAKKVSTSYKLTTDSEPTPVHFYLSIPSYANWEEKTWLVQFAANIASIAEKSRGKFFLNVQSDDQFLFYEGIPASKLSPSFSLPKEKEPKYPIRSWEKVIGRIQSDSNVSKVMIVVSFQTDWMDKFRIAEFARKVNSENLDFIIIAPTTIETTKLASYVKGKFYPITRQESYIELYQELNHLILPKVRLVYLSPWNLSLWKNNEILTDVIIGEGDRLSFKYEISFLHSFYRKAKDPLVFYPVLLFSIILCLSVLYFLRGYSAPNLQEKKAPSPPEKKNIPTTKDFENERNKNELEVYERVYGDSLERARENEIISQMIEREEVSGESYSTAVLILKEGVFAGTQFSIRSDEVLIGSGEACEIVLQDSHIEPVHAKVKKVRGRYLLFDCASESGVSLNGKKLLRPKALFDLDEIKIGRTLISFRGR